jgi:hypothetical protein
MRALPKRTQSAGEELANSISHGMGFIAALVGTPILLLAALRRGSTGFLIGTIVFTSTMLLLYLGSTLYHAWPQTRAKSILRVLDHSAIFLLIAGTYAVRAGSASQRWWRDDSRNHLGVRDFWRCHEGDARSVASSETGDVSLSRDGLVNSDRESPACVRDPISGIDLACGRRHRLYDRRIIFCKRSPSLPSFRLALVCPCRHGLSLCGRAFPVRVNSQRGLILAPRRCAATLDKFLRPAD